MSAAGSARRLTVAAFCLLAVLAAARARAGQGQPIRAAHYPALSPDGSALCFSYRGDLWSVAAGGGAATRLTVHLAYDAYPRWSPDGRWIAFSSNRDGNYDVFLVPAVGGEARQVTCHPADDVVCDWSPDGSRILFSSQRDGRFPDLYTVGVQDRRLARLTHDDTPCQYACFEADGQGVVYARGGQPWWRPAYRGSRNTDVYALAGPAAAPVARARSAGYDGWPLVSRRPGTVYFVSDRSGTANLWRMDGRAEPRAVTDHRGDGVRFPTIARDGSRIAYEYAFGIWTLDTKPGSRPAELRIYAPSDRPDTPTRHEVLGDGASDLAVSPDGSALAFALRGDIWTCKAAGGDCRRLTSTSAPEYEPAWSPDGRRIACAAARNGSLDIVSVDVETRAETPLAADAANETRPAFAPDGRFLAYVRQGGASPGLCVAPLGPDGGAPKEPAALVAPGNIGPFAWAPDSRWLCYARRDATSTTDLWVVPAVGGTPVNVTRYPGMNGGPAWTRDGRHLLFVSTRGVPPRAGPPNLLKLELAPTPDASSARRPADPPGDEGAVGGPAAQAQRPRPVAPTAPEPGQPGLPPSPPIPPRASAVRIEMDGIEDRARPLTSFRDGVTEFAVAPDARTVAFAAAVGGQPAWWLADVATGAVMRVAPAPSLAGSPEWLPDGSALVYLGRGGTLHRLARGSAAASDIAFRATLDTDERVQRLEAFREAWRVLRDRFYDASMHGKDWSALRAKYEPLVAETVTTEDYRWLLVSMLGELNASHVGATPPGQGGGPRPFAAELGLRFDEAYAGPGLRVAEVLSDGPTDEAGSHVYAGEYVMAVDGKPVTFGEGLYEAIRDSADSTVTLTVGMRPTADGARSVKVRPASAARTRGLEQERWVRAKRREVERLSGGAVAYLCIRQMDRSSLDRFERELFGDAQAARGLVIDVRYNPGGRIHDELLEMLARRPHVYEVPRDGERASQPFRIWDRPVALLVNEYSASDAEVFANGFRTLKLGRIVGVPTYGGVIGTSSVRLLDGTTLRVPTTGWFTADGANLENRGVAPDVEVPDVPAAAPSRGDAQLDAAVRIVLDAMRDAK
ncbi:MAG: PD40 domain-containing protein [Chthonomonadales bacterium]|nr:PD40 domain-containing protein [Chthonomonadales bacterium]